jgi:hypothetical protein
VLLLFTGAAIADCPSEALLWRLVILSLQFATGFDAAGTVDPHDRFAWRDLSIGGLP